MAYLLSFLQLHLRSQSYWALKVHVNTIKYDQELKIYRHLATGSMEHSGRAFVRQLEDSFKLKVVMVNTTFLSRRR